ncbi:MAG TPA: invasion associated locus B family protein [Xanthobacteraceae bacterium]|jgi:invasion protein IalB|nr:invasion associated locus B family protein [Xanthobacteraceae bacterium]
MNYRNASAPARPVSRTLTAISKTIGQTAILTVALATASASIALAQQPPAPAPAAPAPVAKPKPAAPPKPKPAAPKPAAQVPAGAPDAQQQAAPDQGQAQGQPQGGDQQQQVQLIFSPWTKFCLKANQNDPNSKQVCFTGKDARIESGMPVVAAVLIEPEGDPKKILRVTLPLGMQLIHGTRLILDQNQPMTAPYVICFTNGCMADYEVTPDMIGKMKKGQQLVVQAINSTAQPISLGLPLQDFAKAYDGPPTDPKVFEEQQQKLQEELQRRADEARKKLEQQQGGAPQSSNAPAPQQ